MTDTFRSTSTSWASRCSRKRRIWMQSEVAVCGRLSLGCLKGLVLSLFLFIVLESRAGDLIGFVMTHGQESK